MLNLSMLERKEKLLDFMNEQRRLPNDGSDDRRSRIEIEKIIKEIKNGAQSTDS